MAVFGTRHETFAIPRWRTFLKRYLVDPTLDLLYPPVCVGCGRVGRVLCDTCTETLRANAPMARDVPSLEGVVGLGPFEGICQQAVHALKYDLLTDVASHLARLMADQVAAKHLPPAVIIPVPLHADRRQARGFNQSELLGAGIAEALGWSFHPDALERHRPTQSQVGLDYQARQVNVRDAFRVTGMEAIKNHHILLVDDVLTTGATLRECAQVLHDHGARTVRAVVVGMAVSGA